MMNKKITNLFYVFVFGIALTLSACSSSDKVTQEQVVIKTQEGEKYVFYAELATTVADQRLGLMNRTSLDEDSGMLFLFGMEGMRGFWMKDTLIPLDIIFIKSDGTIAHVHSMAKPQDEAIISSVYPVKAVLEINGGLSDKLGIEAGDSVIHPFFRNKLAQ